MRTLRPTSIKPDRYSYWLSLLPMLIKLYIPVPALTSTYLFWGLAALTAAIGASPYVSVWCGERLPLIKTIQSYVLALTIGTFCSLAISTEFFHSSSILR